TATATDQDDRTGQVLRVYSNNIENLVTNLSDGQCEKVSVAAHAASMLVDSTGVKGALAAVPAQAPDLLMLQQVSGSAQAQEYADQLSAATGRPAGTYRAIVAWAEPGEWGHTHDCAQRDLGRLKSVQTNAIIYNSATLRLTGSSLTWAAGWLAPGRAYAGGQGCTAYEPPSVDTGARANRWQRTTAVAARFTLVGSGTTVFAASMHLPKQNMTHACAGDGDTGMSGTGIRLSAAATKLLRASAVRVIGVDANRTGIASDALRGYGVTGYGASATVGHRTRIDYLFVRGRVRASGIDHTVQGTLSNHRALYGYIDLPG
ncbi:hypothetical protein, partial [Propionicimonas sp.]|uniref:hypothetical protein n=1 Tax=Propionicimonas sp. TaxID=1955623 RepID=UPI0039E41FB3